MGSYYGCHVDSWDFFGGVAFVKQGLRETDEHDVVFDTLTWTSNWVKKCEY